MPRHKLIALIVSCAFFMQSLDGTVITTALPKIASDFHTDPLSLSMVVTAYLLAAAVFIPISGWVADRYGGATVFRLAIGTFVLGSLFCGIAQGPVELTLARVLQGAGGAMMTPVGRLVLLRSVSRAEFVQAMTWMMVPSQIGQMLGPPIGGWITTFLSWRWIFLINLPIGLVGVLMVSRFIANVREEERRPLDWPGFVLTSLAMFSFLYGIEAVRAPKDGYAIPVGLLVVAVAAGWAAVRHAKQAAHPLIDLKLMRITTFRINFWGGAPFRVAYFASNFLLPLLFQVAFGMSPFLSGVLIFAVAGANVLVKPLTSPSLKRFGFRNVIIWTGAAYVVMVVLCGQFTQGTPLWLIFGVLAATGVAQSVGFMSMATMGFVDVPPPQMSAATTLSQVATQMGGVFGVTMATLMLQGSLAWHHSDTLSAGDFAIVFGLLGAFSALTLPAMRGLPADTGTAVSGHVPKGMKPAVADPKPGE